MFDALRKLITGSDPGQTLAVRGEDAAARFLRGLGYKILDRNWKCGVGEIDIIARDGQTLVFVEVKTRETDDPRPEEQVNSFKQHQLTKAARAYLSRFGTTPPARFDVVAVVWPADRKQPVIRHTIDAFEATF